MEFEQLPVIDWELATKLAGNKKEWAEEILSLTIKNINMDISEFNQLHENKNYSELLKRIHKLHGALCYCGLPRLKSTVAQLESALKNNIMFTLPTLLNQLVSEVNLLLEQYPLLSRCV